MDRELEGLSPWNEEQLREEFSLQALRVIGLLCCQDQPLILVFDQLEGLWLEGNRPVLLRFGEVIKELFTQVPYALVLVTLFPDRWQQFQTTFDGSITGRVAQHVIQLEQPRPDQIEEILDLRLEPLGASTRELFSHEEITAIARLPSIRGCINRAGAVFEHRVRGVPLPPPPSSAGVGPTAVDGMALHHRCCCWSRSLVRSSSGWIVWTGWRLIPQQPSPPTDQEQGSLASSLNPRTPVLSRIQRMSSATLPTPLTT